MGNRVEEAIPLFENATAGSSDPRLLLHLYVALNRAGRIPEAGRVRKSINLNELRTALLSQDDRTELEKLESEIAEK